MSINFISKDSDETRNVLTKSNNIEIMMGSEIDYVIEERLVESMRRGSGFIFDSVDLLYYHLQ